MLQERLRRYPAERYPVQHATASFHLGCALIERDRHTEAVRWLSTARRLFADLPLEEAKAANMLGVAERASGDLAAAGSAFEAAAEAFTESGHEVEGGAASFNLGLVCAQRGDHEAALDALERAGRRFEEAGAVPAAIAVERERGAVLLAEGRLEEAVDATRRAAERALDIGDRAGHGAAANTLGLAQLALGRVDDALAAFRSAASSHPRTVRPQGYAMAKANQALALARAGDGTRARLVARQALYAPAVDQPVADQAERVLAETGTTSEADDALAVLGAAGPDAWEPILREEAAHWTDRGEAGSALAGTVVTAAVIAASEPERAAAAWLAVLLELPPATMESLISSSLEALASQREEDRQRFRIAVMSAMADFHVPQWLRLRDTFAARAQALRLDGWS